MCTTEKGVTAHMHDEHDSTNSHEVNDIDGDIVNQAHHGLLRSLPSSVVPVENLTGIPRSQHDYFADIAQTVPQLPANINVYPQTFIFNGTAFHLNFSPSLPNISIDDAASLYNIQDLQPALADYFAKVKASPPSSSQEFVIGGWHISASNAPLPFTKLRVWYSVKIQRHSVINNDVVPPQTLYAHPVVLNMTEPDEIGFDAWVLGWYEAVLVCDGHLVTHLVKNMGLKGN